MRGGTVSVKHSIPKITFEQFVQLYDFRSGSSYLEDYNTKIIRIHYGNKSDDWFEFGIYDWDSNKLSRIHKILDKRICNSYIDYCTCDEELGILHVFLTYID